MNIYIYEYVNIYMCICIYIYMIYTNIYIYIYKSRIHSYVHMKSHENKQCPEYPSPYPGEMSKPFAQIPCEAFRGQV